MFIEVEILDEDGNRQKTLVSVPDILRVAMRPVVSPMAGYLEYCDLHLKSADKALETNSLYEDVEAQLRSLKLLPDSE